ncbi:hypothetical protein BC940DRAFT_331471 [Gongronella butleri]|nr:hypothetical protein BC940DRAFT_331471 [Gongronella butleri]
MPYCRVCGELGRSQKCKKCGSMLQPSKSSSVFDIRDIDRWKTSKYIDQVLNDVRPMTRQKEQHQAPPPAVVEKKAAVQEKKTAAAATRPDAPPCTRCAKPLEGKTGHLPHSDEKIHWACLVCATCHEPFEFKDWYVESRNQIFHVECAKNTLGVHHTCHQCNKTIENKFLPIGQAIVHPECFQCSGCSTVLTPATIYGQKQEGDIYCRPCYDAAFPEERQSLTSATQWTVVPQPQPTQKPMCELIGPSIVASSGASATATTTAAAAAASPGTEKKKPAMKPSPSTRTMPQFGLVRNCPGCMQRIASVHDECTGPRAAKWHKQCMVCNACKKPLDSSAKVGQATNGRLELTCTVCLLVQRKANQAQNTAIKAKCLKVL